MAKKERSVSPLRSHARKEKRPAKRSLPGTVLLVEDNGKILDINRRILEKEGLAVLSAKTLAEARKYIKIAVPDVAVLDIMLPDGSGIDFLEELHEVCRAPVLFLSAKTTRADVKAGLTAGGNDYITKPYDIDEFRMRVTGFMRLARPVQTRLRSKASPLLTGKELAVAMLAARKVMNRDIGLNLRLSESRVKTCLSGIYRKLGIANKINKRGLLTEILGTSTQ